MEGGILVELLFGHQFIHRLTANLVGADAFEAPMPHRAVQLGQKGRLLKLLLYDAPDMRLAGADHRERNDDENFGLLGIDLHD